ncbi:hypothetical protein [Peptoniphilus genitalis]|uniref:hypothetical protein n=1 Tax=Peptoniphilus genitalis TaxID=3036303 RepID=UPI0024AE8654|nr:hypothetical protein [Peptoniphilus sp. Marseille-Q7072]
MNELAKIIKENLKIQKYKDEDDVSYLSRLIYSSLGLWCLTLGKNSIEDVMGVSKNYLTRKLNLLLEEYINIFPEIKQYFYPQLKNLSVEIKNLEKTELALFIRSFYEETGYFLTRENNYNVLNSGREIISLSNGIFLYFGIPNYNFLMNGLGINTFENKDNGIEINIKEFLIRDSFTPEEFVENIFCEMEFTSIDTEINKLEYFNPLSKKNVYKSWKKDIYYFWKENSFDFPIRTVARNLEYNEYYKVLIGKDNKILFSKPMKNYFNKKDMSGQEYNRLYLALRKYYDNPATAIFYKIDDDHYRLDLFASIPNREYFYLLLNGWPIDAYTNRYNFIISDDSKSSCAEVLENIGFKVN